METNWFGSFFCYSLRFTNYYRWAIEAFRFWLKEKINCVTRFYAYDLTIGKWWMVVMPLWKGFELWSLVIQFCWCLSAFLNPFFFFTYKAVIDKGYSLLEQLVYTRTSVVISICLNITSSCACGSPHFNAAFQCDANECVCIFMFNVVLRHLVHWIF